MNALDTLNSSDYENGYRAYELGISRGQLIVWLGAVCLNKKGRTIIGWNRAKANYEDMNPVECSDAAPMTTVTPTLRRLYTQEVWPFKFNKVKLFDFGQVAWRWGYSCLDLQEFLMKELGFEIGSAEFIQANNGWLAANPFPF